MSQLRRGVLTAAADLFACDAFDGAPLAGIAAPSGRSLKVPQSEGSKMRFFIGDEVREGMRVGTVTDVGTVLIQVKTAMGTSRMVCPWELVRVRPSREGPRSDTPTL
ncbi:MAG: hypothetical protein ACRDTK_03245 [Mycobacterium sp.]